MRHEILREFSDFFNIPSERELDRRQLKAPKKNPISRRNFLQAAGVTSAVTLLASWGIGGARAGANSGGEMSMVGTKENLAEKQAKESLQTIFNIEDRLERVGWQENKTNVDLVRRFVRERPSENAKAIQWLQDASVDAKLSPLDYLDFGADKGKKEETTITALSKSVTAEDIKAAEKLVGNFGFLGMKIFVFDKTDQTLKLPFKMGESGNTAYRIGDTVYVAKTSLDKIPHEAFHVFDEKAHKYLSPEQYAGLEKYKKQLLAGENGRMYPGKLAKLLGWSFLPGRWGEDKSFANAANFYPVKLYYHGGDLSKPREEILGGSAIKINWGGIDLQASKSFPDFVQKLILNYQELVSLNKNGLFGEVIKDMMASLSTVTIEEGFVFGLGDDDPKDFKEIFKRLGDRVVASWLWRGDKEAVLRKYMSADDITMAKERLAALVARADEEFIAEAVKLVHLSKLGIKTDVAIPSQANLIYRHIFDSVNGK